MVSSSLRYPDPLEHLDVSGNIVASKSTPLNEPPMSRPSAKRGNALNSGTLAETTIDAYESAYEKRSYEKQLVLLRQEVAKLKEEKKALRQKAVLGSDRETGFLVQVKAREALAVECKRATEKLESTKSALREKEAEVKRRVVELREARKDWHRREETLYRVARDANSRAEASEARLSFAITRANQGEDTSSRLNAVLKRVAEEVDGLASRLRSASHGPATPSPPAGLLSERLRELESLNQTAIGRAQAAEVEREALVQRCVALEGDLSLARGTAAGPQTVADPAAATRFAGGAAGKAAVQRLLSELMSEREQRVSLEKQLTSERQAWFQRLEVLEKQLGAKAEVLAAALPAGTSPP